MDKKIAWTLTVCIFCITVFISMLAFHQISVKIADRSSFASATKTWEFHFTEPMNPNTFTKETVHITTTSGKVLPVPLEWNEDNTVLTVKAPEEGYTVDEHYTIRIEKQVESMHGKKLSIPFSHTFQAVSELPQIKDDKQLTTLLKERLEKMEANMLMEYSMEDSGSEESAVSANDAATDSPMASETNIQVEGIDEGDQIKTDGNHIYYARDNDIIILTAGKEKSKVIATISEEQFSPIEVYLHDQLLIAVGNSQKSIRNKGHSHGDMAVYPYYSDQTAVFIYDIANPENPKRIREVTLEGFYSTSRKSDGYLYLLANKMPPFHILEDNKLAASELQPYFKDTNMADEGQPIPFEQMYFFPDSDDGNFLLIASIDLNQPDKKAKVETYLGTSDHLYMAKDHLYTAVNKYSEPKAKPKAQEDTMIPRLQTNTEIIQFQIADGNISYRAKTEVNGRLLNQFSMDERNHTFRVATTSDSFGNDQESTNNLYTFDINLEPLGSIEGLAKGEQIYSVRFMEDHAFVVTFEQIDPLFVIDLKNPKQPKVLGELKIPGFSNYLHPLDDDHLIGFGQNTKIVNEGSAPAVRMDGLKIALFDVSDFSIPKEKDVEIIGEGASYSELDYNHKALYKHPEENLYGFPVALFETKTIRKENITYEEEVFLFEGVLLYKITPEDGIVLQDTITQQKENIDFPEWESEIRRLLSVDDALYTLSNKTMQVYHLDEKTIIKNVNLPPAVESY